MARRQITIQRTLGTKNSPLDEPSSSAIDELTSRMASVDVGFEPTDQRVYKINLDRLMPDSSQPRHILPHDLRSALYNGEMSPPQVMQALLARAEQHDTMAQLILGGKVNEPLDEAEVEEKSLLALARSIQEVGLRQPINVYQVNDILRPDEIVYRIGEGERRFWAHQLLVQQGYIEFRLVRCIVESLPPDEELVYRRQAAENAARVDLPAIARARAIQRLRERLVAQFEQSESGEVSQREIQAEIGRQMTMFTGRVVGDRMVRNYLSLLNLSAEAQDLAEAAQLTEKQLRPVIQLKSDFERLMLIKQMITQRWSSRQVSQEVAKPTVTLREVTQTSVEERFETKLISAAKTVASVLTLPSEAYQQVLFTLAKRAKDPKTREVLTALHQTLAEVLQKIDDLAEVKLVEVSLGTLVPNLEEIQSFLPAEMTESLVGLAGNVIWRHLQAWRRDDVMLASRLQPFFSRVEMDAEALRAGEVLAMPVVKSLTAGQYKIMANGAIYWAHELLLQDGLSQFGTIRVELRL